MNVIIGIDPHKTTHTAVAIGSNEAELGTVIVRATRGGNRQLNHAIHMVAICRIRQTGSEGRAYSEKKIAEGKTKKEAIRSLKRQISNTVHRHLVLDAQG